MADRTRTIAKTPQRASSRRGFTLIELLVVISIIAILASMMFPTFSRARESARRIVCISNQKQIGLGIMQYTQDYDERYPIGYPFWHDEDFDAPGIQPPPQDKLLVYVVNPYIKSTQIWDCPSWKGTYTENSTYIGNYSFITGPNNLIGVPDTPRLPHSMAGTNNPTVYPLLFCGIAPQQVERRPDDELGIGKMTAHAGVSDKAWQDNGELAGNSILYADGHAKYSVLSIGQWKEMYDTPR